MKVLFNLLLVSGIMSICFAQEKSDSLEHKIKPTHDRISIDSFQQNIVILHDSLLSFQKIDSIRIGFNKTVDSIKSEYENSVSKIDSQRKKVSNQIDSLSLLNLPTGRYTKILDSINHVRRTTETQFNSKLEALKSKTTGKLTALNLPPEFKEPLQKFTKNIDGLDLNSDNIKIPELKLPGQSLPEMDGLANLAGKAGDIVNIGQRDLPDITSVIDLGNAGGGVQGYQDEIKNLTPGELGQVTRQSQAYQEDIKNISQGNLNDVQKLPETIEEEASKMEGIDELKKQSRVIDEHKAKLDDFRDPNSAKEKVVEVAKKAAVDHFAGKQEQLKGAMEKISKYKQKYSSVSSLKDLPKRPPNPMKGKPFIERLVPGLYLQYQEKNSYLIDINPYVGYKITGRLTSGFGWNHRYAYERKTHTWNKRSIIFGPRGYVDFKLGKGFIAHLEGESMNTFVPSTLIGNPDTGHREWYGVS